MIPRRELRASRVPVALVACLVGAFAPSAEAQTPGLTLRLSSIQCVEEVNEESASEEAYVVLTVVDLRSPHPLLPAAPNIWVRTFGIWEDFDAGEVVHEAAPPFWGPNGQPDALDDPADVAIVVSLLENDNAEPGQYAELARTTALATSASTIGQSDPRLRAQEIAGAIRNAFNGVNLPIPFALDDDHVGTQLLSLAAEDLIASGHRDKLVAFRSGEGVYDLTFRVERNAWPRFDLAPAGTADVNAPVAAVSRIPGGMELWSIGPNGSVQGAFWYEGGQWQRYELAPGGSAATNGGIAALSRIPGSMEVWWTGADGSVQGAFWYEGAQWQRYELAPAGSASTSGGIAAVSRIPGSMELWWTGADGSVQSAFWYEGGQWQRYELAPAGSASTSGGIAAVSRVPESMELWWIGANGSVQDAFWYEGAQWRRFELAPAGSASTSGGIAAVSRVPESMELWWTGANGSVQDAFWYEGAQWRRFELAPAGSASTSGGIAAVSRIPGSMETWWVGPDGSIKDSYWYQ